MTQRDPSIRPVLDRAAGYVVFPKIGEGGAIIGGAYGQGVLFEHGQRIGFVKLEQASVGATLGGKTYAELLVFRDPADLQDVKDGEFTLTADADVVVLTAGAAATASLQAGVTAFVMPLGGLMVDASVAGQRLRFVPAG
jgi:lipid-binding SYLF domain-containing protein